MTKRLYPGEAGMVASRQIEAGAAFRPIHDRIGYVLLENISRQKLDWMRQARLGAPLTSAASQLGSARPDVIARSWLRPDVKADKEDAATRRLLSCLLLPSVALPGRSTCQRRSRGTAVKHMRPSGY